MQSTRDSRQPYRLSNLDLVTESLTLMAGTASSPFCDIWYRRCTPVVVSSVTPRIWDRRLEYHLASTARRSRIAANNTRSSSLAGLSSTDESGSALAPRCTQSVAAPPPPHILFNRKSAR